MNETRVNLKHLLEDIRDSYPLPLEEVIIVELIANALDSDASQINFRLNPLQKTLAIIDNGKGMRRSELRDYHNIAATTKVRGQGIGFAGIGAKLSLLVAESVITESKGGRGSRCATSWHLSSDTRAPWQFVPFSDFPYPRGTAVTITLADPNSLLLNEDFVRSAILRHYYPLFIPEFFQTIYRFIYKKGLNFFIDGQSVDIKRVAIPESAKIFRIIIGRQSKRVAGFGYIARAIDQNKLSFSGLSISTYGKIIKSGWEWIGIHQIPNQALYGFVEIPILAEVLTINKMDFLRDAGSLKKYYRYRKAIQAAIGPVLKELGETPPIIDQLKNLRPITREIEQTLRRLAGHFPELLPLLGIKSIKNLEEATAMLKDQLLVGLIESGVDSAPLAKDDQSQPVKKLKPTKKYGKRPKAPGLKIGFETGDPKGEIARMIEGQILINNRHPAYLKAIKERFEGYHAIFCVAWSLSGFLEEGRSPQQFINQFLASWGREDSTTQRLFHE